MNYADIPILGQFFVKRSDVATATKRGIAQLSSASAAVSQTTGLAITNDSIAAALASNYSTEFRDGWSFTGTGSALTGITAEGNVECQTGVLANSTARKTNFRRGFSVGTGQLLLVNFSKPVFITCVFNLSSLNAASRVRVWFGSTPNTTTTTPFPVGLGIARGIGWEVRGSRLWGQAHNGTILTSVDTSYDFPDTSTTPLLVAYSDNGNVTFSVNGALTSTALGPTGTTSTNNNIDLAAINDSAAVNCGMTLRYSKLTRKL
jgi:hypothetical protein